MGLHFGQVPPKKVRAQRFVSLHLRHQTKAPPLGTGERNTLFNEALKYAEGSGPLPARTDSPESLFQLADELALQLNSTSARRAYVAWRFGLYYKSEQNLTLAKRVMQEGLDRFGNDSPIVKPWLLLELGAIALRSEQYSLARRLINQAIGLAEPELYANFAHDVLPAAGYGSLGNLEMKLGNNDLAAAYYAKERAAAEVSRKPSAIASALLHEVVFSSRRRLYKASIEAIEAVSVKSLASFSSATRAQLRFLLPRAQTSLHASDPALATPCAEAAHAALQDPQTPVSNKLHGLIFLAKKYGEWHRFGKAEELLAEAKLELAKLNSTPEDILTETVNVLMTRTQLLLDRFAIEGAPAIRQQLLEQMPQAKIGFENLLRLWGSTEVSDTGVGYMSLGARSRVFSGWLSLQRMFSSETGAADAFASLMKIQAMGSFARRLNLPPPTLAQIRSEYLQQDEGLVVYRIANGGSCVFMVDSNDVLCFDLGDWSSLLSAREALIDTLSFRPLENEDGSIQSAELARVQKQSQALARVLIPEAARAKLRSWSKVTFVLGGSAVEWIPFESLDVQGIGPLGMHKTVATVSSLPIALFLARRANQRPARHSALDLLFVGAPRHASAIEQDFPALAQLVLPQGELDALQATFTNGAIKTVTGAGATITALTDQALNQTDTLQLLCHGVYRTGQDHPAALILSPTTANPSGILDFDQIAQLASPPLVIVAACNAALAPIRIGEDDGHSLSGAWFRAGADTVIQSQAQLDFQATWALSKALHRHLTKGLSPAEALRQARLELDQTPGFNHPYYHSLVSAMGLAQQPLHR